MEKEKIQNKNSTKGFYFTGALGALIGAAVGSIPWMYALYSGLYAAPLALFIGIFCDIFYRLAYGKRQWKKLFILLPCSLLVLCASTLAADVYTVYTTIAAGALPGIHTADLAEIFRGVLFRSDAYVLTTGKQLLIAAIFAVAGCMTMWIQLKGKPGKKDVCAADPLPGEI